MNTLSRRQFNRLSLAAGALGLGATGQALAAAPTRVALLLSGSIADGGWAQLAHQGIVALRKDAAFKATFVENVAQAQISQVARGYADDGYELVIGHGYEYGSPLLEIAPSYAKTKFFVSSFLPQPSVPANIEYADLAYFDAAYCAGALAALMSPTGKAVGFVGGGDNPTQQNMMKAFIRGAERTVSGIKGVGIVTGDYANAAKGRQAAATLIGNGADVIWHAANETGLGALQAAAAAKVKALGCYADQTAVAPAVIGTSFQMELGPMVETVARSVAAGRFAGGKEWKPTVAEMWTNRAGAGRDRNPALISDAVWAKYQAIWKDVTARKIDVSALLK
jgi:basic membrane protein A